MKHGKAYVESLKLYNKQQSYESREALNIVLQSAKAKFDETVEIAIKLGVDAKHADQQVRGIVVLPNGTGKTVRVLVIAKGDKATEALAAGADIVGAEEVVQKIQAGWTDFDACVTTPDMMGLVGRLGKILGPKGLMPTPKTGSVTMDIGRAVRDIKAGKVEYRVDKTSIVHCPIGKASFGIDKLEENLDALMAAIIKAKPASSKGIYLRSLVLSSTMGPGVKLNYKQKGAQ